MSELIRKAARKWFYESFDCDLLAQMQAKGLIAQAEGFSVSVMAELELERERAFLSFQVELEAIKAEHDALQQRLTDAEKGLKTIIKRCQAGWSAEAIELEAEEVLEDIALKPAEEPKYICDGCGSNGWTGNCDKCIPY